MAQLTDETLMAYADGELDPAMRAEVEAGLTHDPQARQRLQIFVATGAPLAELFDEPLREPVPARLLALVAGETQAVKANRPSWRIPSQRYPALARLLPGAAQWAMAAALSIAVLLIAGGTVWYSVMTGDDLQEMVALKQGQLFAQGPLKNALETAPSGAKVPLGGERTALTMQAVLTFRNRRQAFCRQYDVTAPGGDYAGIACRADDGRWRIELHIAVAPHSAARDRIAPAGKASSSAVEAAVVEVIEGDALGRDDEDALIRNGWR